MVIATRDTGAIPLFIPAYNGYGQVVAFLVNTVRDIDAPATAGGATSLSVAAENGHLEAMPEQTSTKPCPRQLDFSCKARMRRDQTRTKP